MMIQIPLTITTKGRGFYELNKEFSACIEKAGLTTGLCHVFLQHTSASLCICENADPLVQRDLEAFMSRLIPDGDSICQHIAEGPDDMPSHVRTMLTQSFLTLPVMNARLALGRWQSVYLWEHRLDGHKRNMVVTLYS